MQYKHQRLAFKKKKILFQPLDLVVHIHIIERCDASLPEEHLFEHAVGGGNSWETAGGQRMELQVRGDDLCGHLSVCCRSGSTTTTEWEKERETPFRKTSLNFQDCKSQRYEFYAMMCLHSLYVWRDVVNFRTVLIGDDHSFSCTSVCS